MKQKCKCAICKQSETRKLKGRIAKLVVDHNHKTGKVRGLICHRCNVAIGYFKVDKYGTKLLYSTIRYLRK